LRSRTAPPLPIWQRGNDQSKRTFGTMACVQIDILTRKEKRAFAMTARPLLVLVTATSLIVALIAAASVYNLARWSRRSAQAELKLVELKGVMHQLDSLEWQAIARKVAEPELVQEIEQKIAYIRTLTAELRSQEKSIPSSMQVSSSDLNSLQKSQNDYFAALDQEITLIREGKIEQAENLDEALVDPRSNALANIIENLVAERSRSAKQVARFADVGMLASMLVAAAAISALFWFFSRARERESEKLSQALLALRRSEERWQFALSGIGFAVWDRAIPGTSEYTTDRWREILGYAATDSFDRSVHGFEQIIYPEDWPAVQQQMEDLIAGRRRESNVEYRCRNRAGEWLWILSRGIAAEHDPAGMPTRLVGVREDITQSKKIREHAIQAEKMQTIGQLAGGIAHDFNNNLTAMMMSIGLLELDSQLSSEGQRTLRDLANMTDRAAKTTAQLLQFARRQSAQMKVFDLAESVRKLADMLRRLIGAQIEFSLNIPDHILVRADVILVDQAVMNLVLNGRDAMPQGGLLEVELSLLDIGDKDPRRDPEMAAGQYARIRVRDSGVGICAENMAHIFEPFFTTKGLGKGTGLGLASVYGMAHQHQGWASAKSQLGSGSTFDIYLPACDQLAGISEIDKSDTAEATPDALALKSISSVSRVMAANGLCVLLAEDEPQVRHSILRMLKRLGYRTHAAENGEHAFALWQTHREDINILLTDLVMPGRLNGVQLAHEIARHGVELPTLIMSGYRAEEMKEEITTDMNFLAKPFDIVTFSQSLLALRVR
jgi:two-component system, cell cycle sensor histidine kinase and response regulator CckA